MKKYGIILLCMLLLTGCGSKQTETQNENGTEKKENSAAVSSQQTIWQVLDQKGDPASYLKEEDSDVKAVKAAIEQHCSYVDSRTQKDQHLKEEKKLYTQEFADVLAKSGYEDSVTAMYEDNQMEVSPEGLVWYVSTFDQDKSFCKVTVDAKFHIESCSEEYLSAHSLDKDTSYQEQRVYFLEKTDGDWKISNIEKSALGKVGAQEA